MTQVIMLSEHFSFAEAVASETASRNEIENIPTEDTLQVMYKAAVGMEKIRELTGKSIHTNSWYRCLVLNRAIGSKDTSQHPKGEAIDFICPQYGTPVEICKLIIANKDLVSFDQLILEHTWVHISFAILSGKPRGQVLSLLSNKSYAAGLTNKDGVSYD